MAVDILYLYDKQENFIGTLSNKNSSMCPFFADGRYERLDNTASTLEFKTLLKHSSGIPSRIENEGFVVFKDRDGKFVQYKIIIAEEDRTSRQLYVLAVGSWIELTKEMVEPFENVKLSAKQQLDYFLQNTRWRAGQVAYNGVKTMSSDKMMTVLEVTQRLRTTFELEPRFRIEMGVNGEITGRYCDLLERRGIVHPNRFEIGKDVQLLRRKIDTTELVTALYGYGQQAEGSNVDTPLDFSGVQWSKANGDPANKPIGQKWVGSDEALAKYGGKDKKHRFGVHESTVQGDANSLLQHTWEVLQRRSVPKVTYEVDLAVLGDVGIGDTINIVDQKDDDNELYLEARVLELEGPVSEDKKGKAILGNYRELQKPDVDSKIKQLEKILGERLLSLVIASITSSAGNIFKNGIGTTELTANAFLSGLEYDADGTKYTYTWSKHDKTGNLVPSFIKTGKTITVSANEIDEKATYVVTVKNDKVSIPAEITISNVYDGADGKDGKDGEQGQQGPQGVQGPKGADGQSLYTWVKYADSPTSGMSDYPTNKKYIGLAYNKATPVESDNYADYQWAKIEGDQGAPGAPGTTTYTWVKYADDDKGTGMSDSPVGKRYLGLAYNKTTQTESTNPADYSWSPLYDNVKVGGVNLLNDSEKERTTTRFLEIQTYDILADYVGEVITISFEAKADISRPITVYAYQSSGISIANVYVFTPTNEYQRFSFTTTVKDWGFISETYTKGSIAFYDKAGINNYSLRKIKIELGNIATTHSPSIADVEADAQAKANKAEQNANTYTNTVKTQLQKDITDVNNSVSALDNYVDGAFKDGIISNAEATAIEKYLNTVNAEKTDLDGRYLQIYNNTDLTNTTIKTDLYNKKVAYNSAHANLINSINTAIADGKTTLAEKQDVDSKFASYRTALANLTTAFEKALTSISQKQASDAKETAINIASTDATNKANSALSSANTYTNNKDTALRDGLNTGAVAVNATGIHGMLAAGKLDIDLAIQTGIPEPNLYPLVDYIDGNSVTVETGYTTFMYWTFKHSKRYITFRIAGRWAGERNGQEGMGKITGGRCDYAVATRPYVENIIPGSQGSFSNESTLFNGNSYEQARNITVDMGTPNNGLKFIYLLFKGNLKDTTNNNYVHAFLRCVYVAQHD